MAAYKRNFGEQNVIIEIDRASGELHIWQRKLVVPEVEEPGLEMSLEEALEFSPEADIGMEIDMEVPNDTFGRIAARRALPGSRVLLLTRGMDFADSPLAS